MVLDSATPDCRVWDKVPEDVLLILQTAEFSYNAVQM